MFCSGVFTTAGIQVEMTASYWLKCLINYSLFSSALWCFYSCFMQNPQRIFETLFCSVVCTLFWMQNIGKKFPIVVLYAYLLVLYRYGLFGIGKPHLLHWSTVKRVFHFRKLILIWNFLLIPKMTLVLRIFWQFLSIWHFDILLYFP